MRWIFLFLFLLPSVSALAVMPTSIDLGVVQRGEIIERDIQIVNTLGEKVDIYLTTDKQWISIQDEIKLDEKEIVTITIIPNDKDGKYEGNIFVTEILESNSPFGIVNTIAIPYSLTIKGGSEIIEDLDVPKITGRTTGIKIGNNEKWYGLGILIVVIIFGIILFMKISNKKTNKLFFL